MSDLKKVLDQQGVSVLWGRVAEELAKKQKLIDEAKNLATTNANEISSIKSQIENLEAGIYDDTEIRTLIAENAEAIEVLNGGEEIEGSVQKTAKAAAVAEVARILEDSETAFEKLEEIAAWIESDTTGAAEMQTDIATLKELVGDTTVATQISDAINDALKVEGVDKYALASDLKTLTDRVRVLEEKGLDVEAVNEAIAAYVVTLKLAETYEAKGASVTALAEAKIYSDANLATAKAYADGHLTTAQNYTDSQFALIQPLTKEEIEAAIAAATVPAE